MSFDLHSVLSEMVALEASDAYLAAGSPPKFNIDGQLVEAECTRGHRLIPDEIEGVAIELMTPAQHEKFVETKEANLAYTSPETGRFRVNAYFQRGSVAIVLRRVRLEIPSMRSLGLPVKLREIALADRGIVLVTGATGSGKSTTMASLIDYRNRVRSGHIVTIEDPVEYLHRHQMSIVTQREVGIDTFSFHEALKNSLRQAPQVICIGELRDAETVQFAMHAAETGHLVFATLHSTNAILTVERILNFYPPEQKAQVLQQVALNLKAIVCQRLATLVDGGRCAAVELMINTPRIADLITKGDLSALRMGLAAENQDGLQTFDKAVYRLFKRGLITKEEALAQADSANDLMLKLRGIGIEPGSSWEEARDEWEDVADDDTAPGPPAGMPRPMAGRQAAWNPTQGHGGKPGAAAQGGNPPSREEIRYKIFPSIPPPTPPEGTPIPRKVVPAAPPKPATAPLPPAAGSLRKPKLPVAPPDLDDELDVH